MTFLQGVAFFFHILSTGSFFLQKPKTETSKWKIHLPALAVSALIAHKADQSALRLRSGFGKGGERFVFETFRDDQFGPVRPRALTKIFSSFRALRSTV